MDLESVFLPIQCSTFCIGKVMTRDYFISVFILISIYSKIFTLYFTSSYCWYNPKNTSKIHCVQKHLLCKYIHRMIIFPTDRFSYFVSTIIVDQYSFNIHKKYFYGWILIELDKSFLLYFLVSETAVNISLLHFLRSSIFRNE